MIEFILYVLLFVVAILFGCLMFVSHTLVKIRRELKKMKYIDEDDYV